MTGKKSRTLLILLGGTILLAALLAPGTTQGYVQIRKVSGSDPFLAYGVVNDGGAPGQRTGDGAYIPARN